MLCSVYTSIAGEYVVYAGTTADIRYKKNQRNCCLFAKMMCIINNNKELIGTDGRVQIDNRKEEIKKETII